MSDNHVNFSEGYGVSVFVVALFSFGLQAIANSSAPHSSVDVKPSDSRFKGVYVEVGSVISCAAA